MSTSWVVDDLLDEASELFDGPLDELVTVLEEIASLGDVEAPVPSAELALLLAGRPADTRHPVRRRHRRLVPALGGLAAAAVTGLTLTGTAAYANELPPSVQRVVAHLSEDYLPFTFPRPAGDPPAPHHAPPRGAGTRSSGGATPHTEPSGVTHSLAVPVVPSTSGGPTERADGRLVRQDVKKPGPPARSAAPRPAPTPSATDRFAATTVDDGTDAPAVVTSATPSPSPSPSSSPEPSADTTVPVAPPVDPQASPSGVPAVPAPVPSTAPVPDPSFSPPASDLPTSPGTTPADSQQPTTPGDGTLTSTGPDPASGKSASPAVGPDPSFAGSTTTTPPGAPADPGGSQPTGQVSSSPDTSTGDPAVGSEGGPTSAVVADPETDETSPSITPSP
jgi:hypothetical protein